jgi:hypothetical protein
MKLQLAIYIREFLINSISKELRLKNKNFSFILKKIKTLKVVEKFITSHNKILKKTSLNPEKTPEKRIKPNVSWPKKMK